MPSKHGYLWTQMARVTSVTVVNSKIIEFVGSYIL